MPTPLQPPCAPHVLPYDLVAILTLSAAALTLEPWTVLRCPFTSGCRGAVTLKSQPRIPRACLGAPPGRLRSGQTKEVVVYNLVTEGTVEDRVEELALKKKELEARVIKKGVSKSEQESVRAALLHGADRLLAEQAEADRQVEMRAIGSSKDLPACREPSDAAAFKMSSTELNELLQRTPLPGDRVEEVSVEDAADAMDEDQREKQWRRLLALRAAAMQGPEEQLGIKVTDDGRRKTARQTANVNYTEDDPEPDDELTPLKKGGKRRSKGGGQEEEGGGALPKGELDSDYKLEESDEEEDGDEIVEGPSTSTKKPTSSQPVSQGTQQSGMHDAAYLTEDMRWRMMHNAAMQEIVASARTIAQHPT
ncbi:hypothetical protein CYMTET_36311 [Cymbomonas tetramitiformis]|uniref:Uncharacterized protein n=1 Tax=Cymbomonas tetramitiformis TaxID=36881 RepID=A0AAE0CG76_9CHLO|nr:hypothetical protein CYMTET_36311 [Cymbomonas tetramitiformis]